MGWKHQDLLADPSLRPALIRRIAVRYALGSVDDSWHSEWAKSLAPEERAMAIEALRMDTTLPPDRQAGVLHKWEEMRPR